MLNPIFAAAPLTENYQQMKTALVLLFIILGALIICSITFTLIGAQLKCTKGQRSTQKAILLVMYIATVLVLLLTCFCYIRFQSVEKNDSADNTKDPITTTDEAQNTENTTVPLDTTEPTSTSNETEPPLVPEPTYTPGFVDSSNPENWGVNWEIIASGAIVDTYERAEPISFGAPEDYFALPGISTFRGNNFRNNPVYGTVNVTEKTITPVWANNIGSFNGWTGSGWTGQPLIVQWDNETKAIMNLYPSKQEKENLVEVIYATLDGNIYFYDLDDGSYTRDPIRLGMNFKGAGSLDPRGYPIMYVGSGDSVGDKSARMYIISLIDGSVLYERSGNDAFSFRGWVAFDSSPLIDAETDTLIWPGESGMLYTIKLNTNYDKTAGTLSMAPEEISKTRYSTARSDVGDAYWVGYEPSCVIVDRYLYISENGGMFFCIDLNTMKLVWAQDTRDDSNSTPVFEWNGLDGGYIYTAPSLHWTNTNGSGYICVYKLDAKTGEIVWEHRFDCNTLDGVSGGVQSTPLLGKPGTQLEGLILYTIARTPGVWDGKLVAFDTKTGDIVWEKTMDCYTWSSPVAVYDENGNAYIIYADSIGNMFMVDGEGNKLASIELGSNIEASPAVFNDMLVVGSRGQQIFGIQIR